MEGQQPLKDEDEHIHPITEMARCFWGTHGVIRQKGRKRKEKGSGLLAFEQAQDDEGCSSSHGHGVMSFGAGSCDAFFGGQPCIRAFKGPSSRGSGAAERGQAAMRKSEKKDLGQFTCK